MALFDEHGERIRGRKNKLTAEVALAKEKPSLASEVGAAAGG